MRSFAFQATTVGLLSFGLVTMNGCAGGKSNSATTGNQTSPPLAAATNIYVVTNDAFPENGQVDPPQILQFPVTASGSVTPTVTITAPAGVYYHSAATDSEGQLYVGAETYTGSIASRVVTGYEILVYAPNLTSTSTPERTILINEAATYPYAIAVDSLGQIYAVLGSIGGPADIAVYSPSASGAATPVRTINTQVSSEAEQLAFDSSNNLYVTGVPSPASTSGTNGVIAVFSPTATGNATPISQITGTNAGPLQSRGVAVDNSGHIYAADSTNNGTIYEFAAGANGTPTPLKTITVPASTGLGSLLDLAVDPVGNVFVEGGGNVGFARYAPAATGTATPLNIFTSPALNLTVEVSYAIH
jgi:hypothetical protein